MRYWPVTLALTMVACGGGNTPTSPSPTPVSQGAFVQFRLDQNTCSRIFGTQTLAFTFFVDGVQVGNATLGIGTTSPPYPVTNGSHVASASVTNTAIRWQNLNFSVDPRQTFTYVLIC